MILKCVSAVVCNHCVLGHLLAGPWALTYSQIMGENHRQMKEEELGLPEMPGTDREEQVGEITSSL